MSLITAIFCSRCQEPYESSRRPRKGVCGHMICEKCQKNESKCQICGMEGSFESDIINYQAVGILEGIEETSLQQMVENYNTESNRMSIVRCSLPNCCSDDHLRLCVTCAERAGLIHSLSSESADNEMWIDKLRSIGNHIFCSDCIADGKHDKSHKFRRTSEISYLTENVALWHLLIPARLLEHKIEEKKNTGDLASLDDLIDEYTLEAIEYSVYIKADSLKRFEDRIKHKFTVDIHQLPELSAAKEEAFQKVKSIHLENLKLRERQLMYKKKEIDLYHQLVLRKWNAAENKDDWDKTKKDFDVIVKKFETISVMRGNERLNSAEIEQIDRKVESWMKEIIASRKDNEPSSEYIDEKFLQFRTIKKELNELDHKVDEIVTKIMEADQKLREFMFERQKTKSDFKKGAQGWIGLPYEESSFSSSFDKIFLYEVTDRSLRVDKTLIELLEVVSRLQLARLAHSRYFPSIPGRSYEDDIYIKLIRSSYNRETRSFLRDVLSSTVFR